MCPLRKKDHVRVVGVGRENGPLERDREDPSETLWERGPSGDTRTRPI